jgi:LCP family protein required for cell wall assembly
MSLTSKIGKVVLAFLAGVVFLIALVGARVGLAYFAIERDSFEPETARERIEAMTADEVEEAQAEVERTEAGLGDELDDLSGEIEDDVDQLIAAKKRRDEATGELAPYAASPSLPDDMFESFLLVGADLSGRLADAIIYVLLPSDGSAPIFASLPRDLYLPSLCTREFNRINAALAGCRGVATGPELLSLTVEDFTGVSVDHFALVNFTGFTKVIDALGGVEICVENPTRDLKSKLSLPAGCTEADGLTALQWVRSRRTQVLIDGVWQSTGASDFSRQQHQQEILQQLAGKLSSYSSITALGAVAERVAESVRLDSGFSLTDAVSLAWEYRRVNPSEFRRVTLSYEDYRTPAGAAVLLPTKSFNDALGVVYPPAAR